MKAINNLSIGKRLVILVCLSLTVVAAMALLEISNSRHLAQEVNVGYEAITRPLAAVGNAHGAFNAMRTALYDLAHDFNTNEQNRLFKEQIVQSLNTYEQNIILYKEILDRYGTGDPYEREAVAYLYEQLVPLRSHVEYIVSIAETTGREADAVRILRSDFTNVAEDISLDLKVLTEILEAQTYEENLKASRIHRENAAIYIIIAALSAFILIFSAYLIVVSITRPLKEMTSVAVDLSKGKTDVHIGYKSDNELGVLADSFRILTQSISGLISDLQSMTKNFINGDIEYSIDAQSYRGSYHNMVVEVNRMMQIAIEDLKTVVTFLQSMTGGGNVQIKPFPGKKAVLSDSINELAGKVHFDILTGIYNRRYLDESMSRLLSTMRRSGGGPFSVVMIDIDYFKRFNDACGHLDGDDCLRTVAKAIGNSISRDSDFVARYGGEEFTVILPNTREEGARVIADRIINNVRACNIPHETSGVADIVTVSIGITTGETQNSHDATEYIKRADEALYASKENGRNMCTFYSMRSSEQ